MIHTAFIHNFSDYSGAVETDRRAVEAISIPRDEADNHFGFLAMLLKRDNFVSGSLTRERLGWRPAQISLIQDLEQGSYFDVRKSKYSK